MAAYHGSQVRFQRVKINESIPPHCMALQGCMICEVACFGLLGTVNELEHLAFYDM